MGFSYWVDVRQVLLGQFKKEQPHGLPEGHQFFVFLGPQGHRYVYLLAGPHEFLLSGGKICLPSWKKVPTGTASGSMVLLRFNLSEFLPAVSCCSAQIGPRLEQGIFKGAAAHHLHLRANPRELLHRRCG